MWGTFEEELWVRFGPLEGVNFYEALSKLQQVGSLRDYHKEFERLEPPGGSHTTLFHTYL